MENKKITLNYKGKYFSEDKHWFFGHYHEDKSHGKFHCLYNKITEITLHGWN